MTFIRSKLHLEEPTSLSLFIKQNMEKRHQDIIKANYSTLVQNITTSSVAGHLFASNIITDEMRQQIEAEKTSYDRNRKLLSIILRRGPRAFTGLRMALLKANQRYLFKLLLPEDNTVSEYDKKLAMARSLVHDRQKHLLVSTSQRPTVQNDKNLKRNDAESAWMTSVTFS